MHQRIVAAADISGKGSSKDAAHRSRRARWRRRDAVFMLAVTAMALGTPDAMASDHGKHATSKHAGVKKTKPEHGSQKSHAASDAKHADSKHGDAKHADAKRGARRNEHKDAAPREVKPPVPPELASTSHAIDLIRERKFGEATTAAASIGDPLAQKVVEWTLLRHPDSDIGLARYTAFIRANPNWPGMQVLRRRIEERLWQERRDRDAATVRRLIGEPLSVSGRLALAFAEMRDGNRADAEKRVRAVWRTAQMSSDTEAAILDAFPGVLTRADHVARMDRRIGAKDFGAAMRAAKHAGDDHVAIVKGCSAAETRSSKGGAMLDQVSAGMRSDLGYALCRLHWLLRNDAPGGNLAGHPSAKGDIAAAVKLVLAASQQELQQQDTDEWWRERRLLARKLLDLNDPQTAYRVVREAAVPANPYYRADAHFMPGWIALRFLNDPATALEHFAHIDEGTTDPIVLARAAYWRGRALEAAGRMKEMRAQYERAAHFPTAYYGQLARARLGFDEIAPLRPPPQNAPDAAGELVRAANILYKLGEKSLVRSFVTDLAEESDNAATIAALGQLTAQNNDAQSMFLMGKAALARGLALEHYAFPAIGVPTVNQVGGADGKVDRCVVYSIVRTESAFDQHDKSAAKAVGLMQVTPEAGRDTAKRFGISYDWNRLVSDPAYNTLMGTAEIAALLHDYRGSYILTFAGYNAGRGRVQQWVAAHGDPRDPKIDAVDWVERIPFSETRNYVERVMENLQVYRARFGASTATVEPNLHRAVTTN